MSMITSVGGELVALSFWKHSTPSSPLVQCETCAPSRSSNAVTKAAIGSLSSQSRMCSFSNFKSAGRSALCSRDSSVSHDCAQEGLSGQQYGLFRVRRRSAPKRAGGARDTRGGRVVVVSLAGYDETMFGKASTFTGAEPLRLLSNPPMLFPDIFHGPAMA